MNEKTLFYFFSAQENKTFTRQYSQRRISARSDDSPVFLFLFPGCGDALAVLLLFNEREFNFQARTTRPWSLCVSVCRGKSTAYKHNMQAKKNEREKVSASSFFGRMEDSVFYDRRERTGKKSLLSLLS